MSEQLIVVKSFARDWQDQLAMSELEAAGIRSVMTDENIYRALSHTADPTGVKVLVWTHDVDKAKHVLESVEEG